MMYRSRYRGRKSSGTGDQRLSRVSPEFAKALSVPALSVRPGTRSGHHDFRKGHFRSGRVELVPAPTFSAMARIRSCAPGITISRKGHFRPRRVHSDPVRARSAGTGPVSPSPHSPHSPHSPPSRPLSPPSRPLSPQSPLKKNRNTDIRPKSTAMAMAMDAAQTLTMLTLIHYNPLHALPICLSNETLSHVDDRNRVQLCRPLHGVQKAAIPLTVLSKDSKSPYMLKEHCAAYRES